MEVAHHKDLAAQDKGVLVEIVVDSLVLPILEVELGFAAFLDLVGDFHQIIPPKNHHYFVEVVVGLAVAIVAFDVKLVVTATLIGGYDSVLPLMLPLEQRPFE